MFTGVFFSLFQTATENEAEVHQVCLPFVNPWHHWNLCVNNTFPKIEEKNMCVCQSKFHRRKHFYHHGWQTMSTLPHCARWRRSKGRWGPERRDMDKWRPPPRTHQPQPEMVCEMGPGQESGSAPQMQQQPQECMDRKHWVWPTHGCNVANSVQWVSTLEAGLLPNGARSQEHILGYMRTKLVIGF